MPCILTAKNFGRLEGMRLHISFEKEKRNAEEVPDVEDCVGRSILSSVLSVERSKAQLKFDEAADKRLGTPRDQHEAAYIYLALGLRQVRNRDVIIQSDGKIVPATRVFHFAGHAFREIGQLNRAGDAYWRAGVLNGKNLDNFAIRSLAQAKMCYAEIGESDKSDLMHRLEWAARRMLANWPSRTVLTAWWLTTVYGTSFWWWLGWLFGIIVVFSFEYEGLHEVAAITQGHPWTRWISAVYFCIVTTATVGYGDFTPTNGIAELVVIINIVVGYIMLALGTTILGRKVLGR